MKETNNLFTSPTKLIEASIHIIGWLIVIAFPFLMMTRSDFNMTLSSYLRYGSIIPMSFLIIFYVNYFLLIPHYLFKGSIKQFLFINILFILCIGFLGQFLQDFIRQLEQPIPHPRPHRHIVPPRWMFFWRDLCSMAITVGLSVAIRLSGRWIQIENTRREAEKAKTEAELTNLRSQLNPHFLLNTLNNIYALIAFDTTKAQTAVQDLSKLLRHVLYDNQQATVLLTKEVDFIHNYIELMRIRLTTNVKLEVQFDIAPNSTKQIAPLIFISLIENGFKHGISPTEPSHIYIHLAEEENTIQCNIRNSYHPKNLTDKSGSGIDLEQVRKRLELTYPNCYEWKQGVNQENNEYYSLLTIHV